MKIQEVIEEVAATFKVDPIAILQQGGSSRNVATSRYVCAFILKDSMAKTKIASLLGRRNDQYVYSAVNRVIAKSKEDHEFYLKVLKLTDRFGVGWQ